MRAVASLPFRPARACALAALALPLVLDPAPLVAQDSTRAPAGDSVLVAPRPTAQDSAVVVRPNASCNGQIVSRVDIDAQRPRFGGMNARWRRFARLFGLHHRTTRDDVVRRFLLMQKGERCSELRRAESERILRAQPYLSSARVRAVPDGSGGTRLEVVTTDEVPAIVGAAFSRGTVSAVRLGNTNVYGSGVAVDASWRQGFFYRDGITARVTDYQFLGRPYILNVDARRQPLGGELGFQLSHPYLTDLQRIAWRVSYGNGRGYAGFVRPEEIPGAPGDPSLLSGREFFDIGGVFRVGRPGRLSLFGLSMSRERESTARDPVIRSDSGLLADTAASLTGRYPNFRAARLNALWGVRNLNFITVTGFDALRAQQDVRRGFQLGAVLGRSIHALGTNQDDIFVASDLYVGVGTSRSFLGMQAVGEGREDVNTTRWDGILVNGRLAWYQVLTSHHTLITSGQFGGGWRQRVPFQLRLGDLEGGVRGYAGSRVAGAQRAVATIEDRWYLGRFRQIADLGLAPFVEGGRMWAGDVPFGQTVGNRYSAGLGFLGTYGTRSKRLYRIDVAVPLVKDPYGRRIDVRFTSRDETRDFLREPGDIARGRERTVPRGVFRWP